MKLSKSRTFRNVRDNALAASRITTRSRIIGNGDDGIGVAGGWAVFSGGGTLALNSSNRRRPGRDVLRITGNAGGSPANTIVGKSVPSIALTGKHVVRFYVPPDFVGGVYPIYSAATVADPPTGRPTDHREIFTNVSATDLAKGAWNSLSLHPTTGFLRLSSALSSRAWTNAGAATEGNSTPVTFIGFEIQWQATPEGSRFVDFDVWEVNGKAAPLVLYNFDGLYANHASLLLPLFNKFGLTGCASASGNNAAGAGLATAQALYDDGWDVVHQAQRGGDPSPNGYATNSANMLADINSANAQLDAAGFLRGREFFTYAYNARSAATDAILRDAGFKMARSSGPTSAVQTEQGTQDLLVLGGFSIDQTTGSQMNTALDGLILRGDHGIFWGHEPVSGTAGSLQFNMTEFTTHLTYAYGKHVAGEITIVNADTMLQMLT